MKTRVLPVFVLGLLAGLVGDASRWALGTGEWLAALPWLREVDWISPSATSQTVHILLGVAAAWFLYTVPLRRAGFLLVLSIILCFTGSAALSLHGGKVDPFSPAISLLLGGLVGWLLHRKHHGSVPSLQRVFDGQLSVEAQSELEGVLTSDDLQCENRNVYVLTCHVPDVAELRRKLGPAEFLKLTGEFRERATSLLHARRALVLPGSGEVVQACFGVPKADTNDAARATETAELLLVALDDCFSQQPDPRPQCAVSLQQGIAATGIVNGVYQIVGDVLEQSRHLCETSPPGQVTIDAPSSAIFPVKPIPSLPEVIVTLREDVPSPPVVQEQLFEPETVKRVAPQPASNKSKKKRRK